MVASDGEPLHFASLWEMIADRIPDGPALTHGTTTRSWGEFDQRSARLAGALRAGGLGEGSKLACYLFNCSEYFEIFYGALKIRAIPANVNYRYLDRELRALLHNAEAEALFFDVGLSDRVGAIRDLVPGIRMLVEVGGRPGQPRVEGSQCYEDLLAGHPPAPRIERSEDDCFLSYTGGTTGLPKGVMYNIGRTVSNALATRDVFLNETSGLGTVAFAVERYRRSSPVTAVPASPLMHSTGFTFASLPTLTAGGHVVSLQGRSFDPDELLLTVGHSQAQIVAIVGDAFARPIVRTLEQAEADGRRYETSSLRTICSAGTAWSASVKERLLDFIPQVALMDACGATEGVTYGLRRVVRDDRASTANFDCAGGLLVLDPDGRPLPALQVGVLAGPTPCAGYFRDADATARAFRVIDGVQYAIPGDLGRIELDGSLTLIGRGSMTINTGGEKVFPDEVEQVIKALEGVEDCLVLGTPDERFGQSVTAIVQPVPGVTLTSDQIMAGSRKGLAAYKAPRSVVFVDEVPRAANGKPDYPRARQLAGAGTPETVS